MVGDSGDSREMRIEELQRKKRGFREKEIGGTARNVLGVLVMKKILSYGSHVSRTRRVCSSVGPHGISLWKHDDQMKEWYFRSSRYGVLAPVSRRIVTVEDKRTRSCMRMVHDPGRNTTPHMRMSLAMLSCSFCFVIRDLILSLHQVFGTGVQLEIIEPGSSHRQT